MIQLNQQIKDRLEGFSDEQKEKILERAWDACCDGHFLCDYLQDVDILGVDDARDIDPWCGKYEWLRKRIEAYAVECAIEIL